MGYVQAMESLDSEWIQLMMAARDLGLTLDEVKQFFSKVTEHVSVEKNL